MPYYIATISISLSTKSDSEAIDNIRKLMDKTRELKGYTPYINDIKEITNNPKDRYRKLDQDIIKNINNNGNTRNKTS